MMWNIRLLCLPSDKYGDGAGIPGNLFQVPEQVKVQPIMAALSFGWITTNDVELLFK